MPDSITRWSTVIASTPMRVRRGMTPTSSACSSTSSYRLAMLLKSRRILGMSILATIGIAGFTTALLRVAHAEASESRYIDLRRIEPIHGDAAAGARKAAVCHACHGVGAPVAPTFPRLAGQRPDYLYHRLVSFKTASPKDPYYSVSPMRSLVTNLTDADMRDLAVYFAAQTPTAGTVIPAPAAM